MAVASGNTEDSEGSENSVGSKASGDVSGSKPPKGNTAATETEELIKLTPNLEEGYITITMNSPQAEVTFINSKGEKVRTVPKYQTGSHINISKMKKGTYTVRVKTASGTRSVKFTLN